MEVRIFSWVSPSAARAIPPGAARTRRSSSTGATAAAACRVLRAEEAAGVVLAVPVAPRGWERELGDAADEYVAAWTPRHLLGVGRAYADFTQVTDDEVLAILDQAGAR